MGASHEIEFRRATLGLAADAKAQIALFPPFVCFGDELVLDWGEALRMIRETRVARFPAEAESAISKLDQTIDAHSGKQNERMFSDPAALSDDPRWDDIRSQAAIVCSACGWKIEPPWPSSATYVPGR
jgi:hypothetical protein